MSIGADASSSAIGPAVPGPLADDRGRYRLMAENASDVVYQVDLDGIVEWISPSVERILGWTPSQLVGTRAEELVVEEDRDAAMHARTRTLAGAFVPGTELRWRRADGEARWMSARAQPIGDGDGREVSAVVLSLRDIQSEVIARRAARTLAAGAAVMVESTTEGDLLRQMCAIAVSEGGYRFAWYGRPLDDPARTIAKVASAEAHRSYLDGLTISWGGGPYGLGPAGKALRSGTVAVVDDVGTQSWVPEWTTAVRAEGFRSIVGLPVYVEDHLDGVLTVYAPEPCAFDDGATAVLGQLAVLLGHGIERLRVGSRLAAALDERSLLTTAIDQAHDSLLMFDPTGVILYANPATTATSGFAPEELVGSSVRTLCSDLHPSDFYQEVVTRVRAGLPWRGVMFTRRADGTSVEEEVTLDAVRDASGAPTAYVTVLRDLTRQRRLEADLDQQTATLVRHHADREMVMRVMDEVHPGPDTRVTAARLCEVLVGMAGVDTAMVLQAGDRVLVPLAIVGQPIPGRVPGRPVGLREPGAMLEHLAAGPWAVDVQSSVEFASMLDAATLRSIRAVGVTGAGLVALHWSDRLVGVLAVFTSSVAGAGFFADREGLLAELGSFTASMLGSQMDSQTALESARGEVRDLIGTGGFTSVFQPIVELPSGRTRGFEALTRFADGIRPDVRFLAAAAVGMGLELERACLSASLAAAASLPGGTYVTLNVSPEAAVDPEVLALLATAERPVVVEITEHAEISDYPALRAALAETGCAISVDDAGAGYASLAHILELLPAYVKLDISLVRNIHADPARQALVAGLVHFAAQTGITLVAEGVEVDAEAAVLEGLGVACAQGFLFGRPGEATDW